MRVGVCVKFTYEMNDYEREQEAVYVQCLRCGRDSPTSFISKDDGGARSLKRCVVLLRKECPNRESNLYVAAVPSACKC